MPPLLLAAGWIIENANVLMLLSAGALCQAEK
jgi:hypothetical protein